MPPTIYCVPHAEVEVLVPAAGVADGLSTCGSHGGSLDHGTGPGAGACADCAPVEHRAYFVVEGAPRCIRHAADATFPYDDMRAHDMAHAAYLQLRAQGVTDAY